MNISGLMAPTELCRQSVVRHAGDNLIQAWRRTAQALSQALHGRAADPRRMPGNHLLRDMGLTPFGLSEAALADRNELSPPGEQPQLNEIRP